jgi:hypothetical protein
MYNAGFDMPDAVLDMPDAVVLDMMPDAADVQPSKSHFCVGHEGQICQCRALHHLQDAKLSSPVKADEIDASNVSSRTSAGSSENKNQFIDNKHAVDCLDQPGLPAKSNDEARQEEERLEPMSSPGEEEKKCVACVDEPGICIFWHIYGRCAFNAASCKFAHFRSCSSCNRELEIAYPPNFIGCVTCYYLKTPSHLRPRIVCRNYKAGRCNWGNRCNFAHFTKCPECQRSISE